MAGKSAGFAIGIGIADSASAGLDRINKRIAAMSAPAERFNKSLAKFGEVTGINRAAEGMQTLGDRALGAARAVEHLRLIAIALRMVSTAASVHISGADFMSTSPMGANKPIEDIEASLLAATKSALDELVWWAHATMAAKAA